MQVDMKLASKPRKQDSQERGNDGKQRERGNKLLEQRSGWVWGRSKGVLLLGGLVMECMNIYVSQGKCLRVSCHVLVTAMA